MCEWGDTIKVWVTIPADLNHTGKAYPKFVNVDRCIADLVKVLNENNYPTRGSCCGHGKHPVCIFLADGRDIIIKEREQ